MTSPAKINNPPEHDLRGQPKILVAPLDWGLGHATRCIPIIKELLSLKCVVIVAASGGQKALLEQEFPSISFIGLPGYDIKYGKNHAFTQLKILFSIPKILIRVKRENAWFRDWIGRERPDAVISDNRYGLYADGPLCVFMTHQLAIRSPLDAWPWIGKWVSRRLQRWNYHFIDRFSMCWVPDHAGSDHPYLAHPNSYHPTPGFPFAGTLSHPRHKPHIPVRYIGPLSRFEPLAAPEWIPSDLVVLISGPEPQRSVFERIMREQLRNYGGNAILVRGLPGISSSTGFSDPDILSGLSLPSDPAIPPASSAPPDPTGLSQPPARLRVFNHLPAAILNRILCGTALVIARPGYSSVMDLFRLNKRCVFVPTPGQTEQQYLGEYLSAKGLAICIPQSRFELARAMEKAAAIGEPQLPWDQTALTSAIAGLLRSIDERKTARPV